MLEKMKAFWKKNEQLIVGIAFGVTIAGLGMYAYNEIDKLNPDHMYYGVTFNNIPTGTHYKALVTGSQLAIMEAEKSMVSAV